MAGTTREFFRSVGGTNGMIHFPHVRIPLWMPGLFLHHLLLGFLVELFSHLRGEQ